MHQLIDTLPEQALQIVQGVLERFQVWPPAPPERPRRWEAEAAERTHRAKRLGGGGIGGGGHRTVDGQWGHDSTMYYEDTAQVIRTYRYDAGHELIIDERVRLSEDGERLQYSHAVTGPDGATHARDFEFGIQP